MSYSEILLTVVLTLIFLELQIHPWKPSDMKPLSQSSKG